MEFQVQNIYLIYTWLIVHAILNLTILHAVDVRVEDDRLYLFQFPSYFYFILPLFSMLRSKVKI